MFTSQIASCREISLMQCGESSLTDAELLAVFLGTGTRVQSVIDLAQQLLVEFRGLRRLLEAEISQVMAVPGIGPAKYAALRATLELTQRYLESAVMKDGAITDPSTTRRYVSGRLRHYEREVFACLYLDNQHRLIMFEELFFGTIDGASVHPREVVKRSLRHNAAAVIFAHNHPSGVAEPSQADQRITRKLISVLSLIDVRLLDHMVVGDREVVSFAERGLL